MRTESITIAVVGFSGWMGVRHTQYVLDNVGTDPVTLVDPGPTAADVAKKMSPSTPYFMTVGEMLSTHLQARGQALLLRQCKTTPKCPARRPETKLSTSAGASARDY